jgi:predicted dehydrogenase
MALYLTPEKKSEGQKTYADAVVSRRGFLKGFVAAAGAAAVVTPAVYFGYKEWAGNPVKVGLIGAGDEGGVLVGEHPKDYLQFVAYSDIRPYNQERIFTGQPNTPRKGFNAIYGEDAKKIKLYEDYNDLLNDPSIEAVVIALPLHLHAPVAIEAMRRGKHVLCEKLMAWNVDQCKQMIKAAKQYDRILTIGHQRHYSLLYAHAVELLNSDRDAKDDEQIVGDIRHIRALWHRNNSWPYPNDYSGWDKKLAAGIPQPKIRDGWFPPIYESDFEKLNDPEKLKKAGFKSIQELVRWRLYDRTGGGHMAELGSHQLDACSIFLHKVHPLAVQGVGGKFFFRDGQERGREADDGVFVTFEFPGPNYYHRDDKTGKPTDKVNDKDDIVVVTYSSVDTNSFEKYGECVMGSRGTLVVEQEQDIMLYPANNPNKKAGDKATGQTVTAAGGGKPAVDSSSTTGSGPPIAVPGTPGGGPVSRGYTEEMAHFAHCVRMFEKAKDAAEKERWRTGDKAPRCHGKVAMADAIVALTANMAMKTGQRIEFKPSWFDPESKDVPEVPEHTVKRHKEAVALDPDGKPVVL